MPHGQPAPVYEHRPFPWAAIVPSRLPKPPPPAPPLAHGYAQGRPAGDGGLRLRSTQSDNPDYLVESQMIFFRSPVRANRMPPPANLTGMPKTSSLPMGNRYSKSGNRCFKIHSFLIFPVCDLSKTLFRLAGAFDLLSQDTLRSARTTQSDKLNLSG